ncbi:hypothetical protein TELCIR_13868 [Teladorsagia circumcincta]|uniref:Uncharacterized protein n=1 Tax=Teladorsagia circumcincta TaxID=45464 RepID=A0A2G9U2P4_TELCI|nr:hypothetical protein TELCIR_13868 [Teladorsagia circumcincta]
MSQPPICSTKERREFGTIYDFQLHKNRVRTLKEVPYSIKEAEAAAGRGHYQHVTLKSKVNSEATVTPMQDDAVGETSS